MKKSNVARAVVLAYPGRDTVRVITPPQTPSSMPLTLDEELMLAQQDKIDSLQEELAEALHTIKVQEAVLKGNSKLIENFRAGLAAFKYAPLGKVL